MLDQPLNVLFLCTGNSARSILGEAILNQDGEGRFKAYSAGSNPIGTVNPWAIHTLKTLGYPADGYSSKSWSEFAEGPEFDLIFTVCDSAAAETCPVWPGRPTSAHWGIPDPAAVECREGSGLPRCVSHAEAPYRPDAGAADCQLRADCPARKAASHWPRGG